MNSSSAYTNVLLKSPVQPQVAAAPKREYQDDHASVDFHKTLQSVRDNERPQDEKIVKSPSNKKAAENPQQTNQSVEQKKPSDDSAPLEENCTNDDVAVTAENISNKKANKNSGNKESKTTEQISTDSSVIIPVIPVLTDTTLPTDLGTSSGEETALTVDADTQPLPALATVTADDNSLVADTLVEVIVENTDTPVLSTDSKETLDANVKAKTETDVKKPVDNNSLPVADDLQIQQTNTQLATNEAVTPAPTQAAAIVDVTQQSPGILVGTAASVKTPDAQLKDVADTLSTLVPEAFTQAKPSAKTSPSNDTNTNNSANAETEIVDVSAQPLDTKSSFEKMLQTVARTSVSTQEQTPAATPVQHNPTTTQGLDSLVRMSDTSTPAARGFVVQTAVSVPVGQPQWSQAVGEKVLWLAAQNVSSAEINLHPKDLGPMQVKVTVNQEQTSVSFTSHHPVVREVLDQNLNRLRDMFSEQGLNLVNVDVSDKSFSRQHDDAKDQKGAGANNAAQEEEAPVAVTSIVQQRLVDHYA